MHAQLLSYVTLCDPMDCSPPSSSVHGISQARILESVAISSRGSSPSQRSNPRLLCLVNWQVDSLALSHLEGTNSVCYNLPFVPLRANCFSCYCHSIWSSSILVGAISGTYKRRIIGTNYNFDVAGRPQVKSSSCSRLLVCTALLLWGTAWAQFQMHCVHLMMDTAGVPNLMIW